MAKESTSVSAVGRRKEAVARVRLGIEPPEGKGQIIVNGKPIAEYFPGETLQKIYNRPQEITQTAGKYAISVKVAGGGQASQLRAVIHAIARALVKVNPSLRTALKKESFLTRDPRVKERRKYGHAQKARAKKQSPKR